MATEDSTDTVACDYNDCDVCLPKSEMVQLEPGCYVCPECEAKMENSSGYCSLSCQLGYGCDDSC